VNTNILIDMTMDLRQLSCKTECANRTWRYMILAIAHSPTTIVIGQSSYSENIVPSIGSAFSQTLDSSDTPTTSVLFSDHFENVGLATEFLRSNWKLLSQKCMFVNADYYIRNNKSRLEYCLGLGCAGAIVVGSVKYLTRSNF
jgi:hypothetical protein